MLPNQYTPQFPQALLFGSESADIIIYVSITMCYKLSKLNVDSYILYGICAYYTIILSENGTRLRYPIMTPGDTAAHGRLNDTVCLYTAMAIKQEGRKR